jgi:DNA polymerase III delta prime subunit
VIKQLSNDSENHLTKIRAHYENCPAPTKQAHFYREILAAYYNFLIPESASVLEVGCGAGDLLSRLHAAQRSGLDLSPRQIELAKKKIPDGRFYVQAGENLDLPDEHFDYIIVSETANLAADVQRLLERLKSVSHAHTRLIVNISNSLWRPMISLAMAVGLRHRQPESNWLSKEDIAGLMYLTGWELIRHESRTLCPVQLFGIERVINRFVAPLLTPLCFSVFSMARPVRASNFAVKTVSVVLPARNEAGTIEAAVSRTPDMGLWTELIFVENNSNDNTWDEIQRIKQAYPQKRIKILQKRCKGKWEAVQYGFGVADGELLMILDADLTTAPEELPKFYDAVVSGRCDFANGSRLVYPMDSKAMRFLNLCANKLFAILFDWLLGQPVKDTLCGTKVLTKESYERIMANRFYFGNFDPFGDFVLLFGASKLNLKILDIPIRYKERFYGKTNIHRWKHGWLLVQMVAFAALKLKFI